MSAVSLLDVLTHGSSDVADRQERDAHVGWLADKLVESSLANWRWILEYEQHFGLQALTSPSVASDLERSLHEIYRDWADDAAEILSRARQLAGAGRPVQNAEVLEDAHCRALARLKLTPEMLARAMEQVRQGQTIPLTELRDELRSRVRA
jgi:hypothetical protein